jgi:hypothetical protein
MSNPVNIKVQDYSQEYGGVPVIIDGREASFNSVVGYALYNNEDPVEAVLDCKARMVSQPYNGHKLVWINLSSVCISGDPGYYAAQEARRALMPKLSVGDLVRFESNVYQIVAEPNKNYGLRKV